MAEVESVAAVTEHKSKTVDEVLLGQYSKPYVAQGCMNGDTVINQEGIFPTVTRVITFSPLLAHSLNTEYGRKGATVDFVQDPPASFIPRKMRLGNAVISGFQSGAAMLAWPISQLGRVPPKFTTVQSTIAEETFSFNANEQSDRSVGMSAPDVLENVIKPLRMALPQNLDTFLREEKLKYRRENEPALVKLRKALLSFGNNDDPAQSTPLILLARTLKADDLNAFADKLRGGLQLGVIRQGEVTALLNQQDKFGRTVLHYSMALGLEISSDLQKLGADQTIRDNDGRKPEELAQHMAGNKDDLFKMLSAVAMHPLRDVKASSNAFKKKDDMPSSLYLQSGQRLYHVLASKEVLEQLSQASDFQTRFPREVQARILQGAEQLSGQSIGDQCFENVQRMVAERNSARTAIEEAVGSRLRREADRSVSETERE